MASKRNGATVQADLSLHSNTIDLVDLISATTVARIENQVHVLEVPIHDEVVGRICTTGSSWCATRKKRSLILALMRGKPKA